MVALATFIVRLQMTDTINEVKTVGLIRVEDRRVAIVEYDTTQGKFYAATPLYRTKEVAIAAARKQLSKQITQ